MNIRLLRSRAKCGDRVSRACGGRQKLQPLPRLPDKSLRAQAEKAGRRAGQFKDEAGNTLRGFAHASGQSINPITDDACNALDAVSDGVERARAACCRRDVERDLEYGIRHQHALGSASTSIDAGAANSRSA